jgi:outer membrane protein TolC
VLALCSAALAQQAGTPSQLPDPATLLPPQFLGGQVTEKPVPGTVNLSLLDAIDRGLKHNLGLLLTQHNQAGAAGSERVARADLLPNITTRTAETIQQNNLAAFGFPLPAGTNPVVGPFSVFDARAYLTQPILDLKALANTRTAAQNLRAAQFSYKDAREIVVLAVADLYLRVNADAARVEAAQAELNTAQAVHQKTLDMKNAGMAAGIDVLRSQVEMQSQQQRVLTLQHDLARHKLDLARAIGLPLEQQFALSDAIPYSPAPPVTLDHALELASAQRPDYQRAQALVAAAESAKKAARAEGLPSLQLTGDYGDLGRAPGSSHGTFTAAAALKVPIFQGGKVRGHIEEADAVLQQRKAELASLQSEIEEQIRTAFMDLDSAAQQVEVTRSSVDLAKQQVQQAQDRFSAGVSSSLEITQAQEALAAADDSYITSVFAHNIAKANLARSIGVGEATIKQFLGGKP